MSQWLYCPSDGYRFRSAEQRLCPVCCRMRGTFKQADKDAKREPWRKVLYLKQNYPDNYTDASFLEKLQMNKYARRYDYWTTVKESGAVTQHLSTVVLFATLFVHIDTRALSAEFLLALAAAGGVAFWLWSLGFRHILPPPSAQMVKSCVLMVFILLGMSPILKTLTDTISTDSIHAMAALMLLLNLFTHDYGRNVDHHLLSGMNEAMFAAVCLASRLPTSLHGFALLTLALEMFTMLPFVSRSHRQLSLAHFTRLTIGHVVVATCALLSLSRVAAGAYLLAVACITYLAPVWLISIQKYKREIHGPWDEAIVIGAE